MSQLVQEPRRHLLFLDLVRALAAQAVLVGHATILAFPTLIGRMNFFYVQSWAVVVFLGLSGYLIGGSLLARVSRGSFTLSGYIKDRFARIFVPLLPLIPIVLLGDRLFLGERLTSRYVVVSDGPLAILTNVLMLQDNWVMQAMDRLFGLDLSRRSLGSAAPWWTVALEWCIYLSVGCALALATRTTRHPAVALAVGAFATVSALGTLISGSRLILAWMVGAAFALLEPRSLQVSRWFWRMLAVVALFMLLAVLWLSPGGVYTLGSVLGTSVFVLAAHRSFSWDRLLIVRRPVRFAADYSYSLYLIHFSVLIWVRAVAPAFDGLPYVLAMTLAGNVAAIGCWFAFERHFPVVRVWLDRLKPVPIARTD